MAEAESVQVPSGWNFAIDLLGNMTWHGPLATPDDIAFARLLGMTGCGDG